MLFRSEIQRLHFKDGLDHFDADIHSHSHFLCTECGSVLDIDYQSDDDLYLDERVNSGFDGRITGHITYFQGICPECCKTSV